MREPWEDELAKVDRLQPSDEVRDRVGSLSPERPPNRHTDQRLLTIAIALTVSLAAGLFAWTALRPAPDRGPAILGANEPSDLPHVVSVVCAASGTQVSTPTVVSERGVRFEITNPGNLDEVIIEGTSGGAAEMGVDINLSSGLQHTFALLPPADYVLGCYSDNDVPRGSHDTIVNAPGMQPFEVLDPDHNYVNPVLQCDGDGQAQTEGFIALEKGTTYAEAARAGLVGLKTDDTFEPSGYIALADKDGLGMYRIVRDGNVIGNLRLSREINFDGALSGFLESCRTSKLGFEDVAST